MQDIIPIPVASSVNVINVHKRHTLVLLHHLYVLHVPLIYSLDMLLVYAQYVKMELIYRIQLIHIVQYVVLVPILILLVVTYNTVTFVLLVHHRNKVVVIVVYVYLDIILLLSRVVSVWPVLLVNTILSIIQLAAMSVHLVVLLPPQLKLPVVHVHLGSLLIVLI
jgi:hypothetical protein